MYSERAFVYIYVCIYSIYRLSLCRSSAKNYIYIYIHYTCILYIHVYCIYMYIYIHVYIIYIDLHVFSECSWKWCKIYIIVYIDYEGGGSTVNPIALSITARCSNGWSTVPPLLWSAPLWSTRLKVNHFGVHVWKWTPGFRESHNSH